MVQNFPPLPVHPLTNSKEYTMRPENETIADIEGQTITTRAPKAVEKGKKPEDWSISLADPFLGDLEELSTKYGAEVIAESARAQLRVKFQGAVRSLAEAGKSDEEIEATMKNWKPGDKLGLGGDPEAVILKNFGNMSPEQRAQLLAMLSAQAN